MEVLDLMRKAKLYAEVAESYGQNESSIREIVQKEKEFHASVLRERKRETTFP